MAETISGVHKRYPATADLKYRATDTAVKTLPRFLRLDYKRIAHMSFSVIECIEAIFLGKEVYDWIGSLSWPEKKRDMLFTKVCFFCRNCRNYLYWMGFVVILMCSLIRKCLIFFLLFQVVDALEEFVESGVCKFGAGRNFQNADSYLVSTMMPLLSISEKKGLQTLLRTTAKDRQFINCTESTVYLTFNASLYFLMRTGTYPPIPCVLPPVTRMLDLFRRHFGATLQRMSRMQKEVFGDYYGSFLKSWLTERGYVVKC